ncbi:magnesium protoporphyrin IX S-adenosyl methionine O-methyl transferase [Klebsormidium nitens]|uniref:Magnesium protoporphyrin IX S-adenosyl methionine O-methyl transferase n=1 Tax=Klebsormidium nitens TaxID=105231 RepID=A0A1Y1IQY4_KLENI|nr:magnesium protoporphyrin IX S-adenosyl methionine O-methyl transferase [Klebsormidium nitens]|eukprot:GAQ91879.1 magnesium protoporphyrin IX S-adenosyl methionine O-methyl transferase [Klebsormidium nitens]
MAAATQSASLSGRLSCRAPSSPFPNSSTSALLPAIPLRSRHLSLPKTQCSAHNTQRNTSAGEHCKEQALPLLPFASGLAAALVAGPVQAADLVAPIAEGGPSIGVAVAGLAAAAAAVVGAVKLTDPEARRQKQAARTGGDEKTAVKNYFNSTGFDRWKRIYGETDDVNKVQLDIRTGHAQTVDKVLNWLKSEGSLEGITVADAGCGTGSLAIPLAMEGAKVSASDISEAMVSEAEARWAEQSGGRGTKPVFEASDLESLTGKYHTVACLDVFIHYPDGKAQEMVKHLASLAEQRLIISFAPKTLAYLVLKRIGELFPGPSKATRAYLHAEDDIEAALREAGWKVTKKEMTATSFYFSRLFEAVPIS